MPPSSAKKPEFSGQTIMNQIDPGLETTGEEFFRQEAIVVRLLLGLSGLSQDRLAELSEVGQNTISLYQRGKLVPSPETLDQLALAAGWPLPGVEQMAITAIRLREHPRAFAALQLDSTAVEVGRKVAVLVDAALLEIGLLIAEETPEPPPSDPPSADDAIAEDLWARLADLDDQDRRFLIDFSSAFHEQSLALRLEKESERLAAERPADAAELGRLAQYVASLSGGGVPT
ncbi:MAG TPA: helix-turn-helix transcriptional regulator [Thermoanaerobaculia bacterium]|jgi:transcriptional regulator with XRE-family HTH domain|nr:helix-turn-helix transcriptional regulator [Thermoanaerobaculia bacterium]